MTTEIYNRIRADIWNAIVNRATPPLPLMNIYSQAPLYFVEARWNALNMLNEAHRIGQISSYYQIGRLLEDMVEHHHDTDITQMSQHQKLIARKHRELFYEYSTFIPRLRATTSEMVATLSYGQIDDMI
jgi:hypothetical protein